MVHGREDWTLGKDGAGKEAPRPESGGCGHRVLYPMDVGA